MSPPTLPKRATSTTTTSANASSTPTSSINAFTSNNGSLSIGAKAGIALAALIVTALILVGILFIMKRKKQSRKASMAGAGPAGTPLARDRGSNGSSLEGADGLEKRGVRDDVQVVRT